MVCDGVLHSHTILKTLKMSVKNNKLARLSIKFSNQKFMFHLYCQKQFCEQFLCCPDFLWLCRTPSQWIISLQANC